MPGYIIAYKKAFILVDHILSPINTFPSNIEKVNPCELLKLPAVKLNARLTLKLPLYKIQKNSLFYRMLIIPCHSTSLMFRCWSYGDIKIRSNIKVCWSNRLICKNFKLHSAHSKLIYCTRASNLYFLNLRFTLNILPQDYTHFNM
jgi:hypothetical protein